MANGHDRWGEVHYGEHHFGAPPSFRAAVAVTAKRPGVSTVAAETFAGIIAVVANKPVVQAIAVKGAIQFFTGAVAVTAQKPTLSVVLRTFRQTGFGEGHWGEVRFGPPPILGGAVIGVTARRPAAALAASEGFVAGIPMQGKKPTVAAIAKTPYIASIALAAKKPAVDVEGLAIPRIPIFADVAVTARKPNVLVASQVRAQVMYLWPQARRFIAVA